MVTILFAVRLGCVAYSPVVGRRSILLASPGLAPRASPCSARRALSCRSSGVSMELFDEGEPVIAEPPIAHNVVLPAPLVSRVPVREKLVLSFVLAFLEEQSLPAQLLVNGGYVRDLLLGKLPDDLDLSLCLRDCPPHVTVDSIIQALPAFATARPELCISSVQVTTILSDTSKDKNVDTAKVHLSVGNPPEKMEVDFMPTIGEETYDDTDRVPVRDVRGTAEQDALRRDLTIGAMLLQVEYASGEGMGAESGGPSGGPLGGGTGGAPRVTSAQEALDAAETLQWRLLDYYGGIADLRAGVLRSPYPSGRSAEQVWHEVLRTDEERRLALALGIAPTVPSGSSARDAPLDDEQGVL